MPRKTARAELERQMEQFFDETKAGYMKDVMATRQPARRRALLAEADALDKVKGRFYNWLTGQVSAA